MPAITDGAWAAAVRIRAPAKVNLTLHVTGQRPDRYHLLDSLVAFADVGDEIAVRPADAWTMTTEGPEAAGVPSDASNLVLQVAGLFRDIPGAAFRLTKTLPVASGIGGGSADAAAAFRGLLCLSRGVRPGEALPGDFLADAETRLADRLLSLGADIPACLRSRTVRMRGIGEQLSDVPDLPPLFAVLVNPRRAVSTPAIFGALREKSNPAMPPGIPRFADAADLALWLRQQRNDLEPPAIALEPAIADALRALAAVTGCLLARMSGSGATCFGLFPDRAAAEAAAEHLRAVHPGWWVRPAKLGTMTGQAMPQVS